MDELLAAFETGRYRDVITTLEGRPPATARESAMLGLAFMFRGEFAQAETPLIRASILGDAEAQVELGNLLRLTGRYDEATAHFESIIDTLSDELLLRALRWWGMTEFQAGRTEAGLRRCERAWYGYLAYGDDELTARVTHSLAWMHGKNGNFTRAAQLYQEAIRALPVHPDPHPRLSALHNLLNLQIESGAFDAARDTLAEAYRTLAHTEALRPRALLFTAEAELLRLSGDTGGYARILEQLAPMLDDLQDHLFRVWVTSRLAEQHSLRGQHGRALEVLHRFGPGASFPPELVATNGVLARRRGDHATALAELSRAASAFRERGRAPELVRALLHYAGAALSAGREDDAATALREALTEMLALRQHATFRPDLEELSELLHHAVLEPDLAPYLEPVLDNLANLAGAPRLPEDGLMRLQVTTLGRVAVYRDNAPVDLTLKGSALLLAYLALHPGRTRAEIQLDLYPDKDPTAGANYVRAAIKELRDRLGTDVIVFDGPHNAPWYRLGRYTHVDLDLTHFTDALTRGELARALALYRGSFMPGIEDSAWVTHKREEALLALTFALREQMRRYQAEGDHRRFILLANQYLRADPYDREVLEARVECARLVGSSQELARYVADLHRLHN